MPTRYFSKTATNGYVVGNDSNNGQGKRTAYATIAAGITEAVAAGGDWIFRTNDGMWIGDDLGASGYVILGANPPTIQIIPENPFTPGDFALFGRGTVFVPDAIGGGVFRYNSDTIASGYFLDLGPIGLGYYDDPTSIGGVDPNHCLMLRETFSNQFELILDGTYFMNPTTYGINAGNIKVSGSATFIGSRDTGVRSFVFSNAIGANGDWDMSALHFEHDYLKTSGHGGVHLDAAAAGASVTFRNVTGRIRVSPTASGSGTVYGLMAININRARFLAPALAVGNDSSETWGVYGACIRCNDGTLTASRGLIENGEITADMNGSGFLAAVGSDLAGEQADRANDGKIIGGNYRGSDAYIAGGGHGVGVSQQNSARLEGFKVSHVDIGALLKQTTGSVGVGIESDYIGDAVGGGMHLRRKGATDSDFYNCTQIVRDGYFGDFEVVDSDSGTDSSGGVSAYNSRIQLGGTLPVAITVDPDNSNTFTENNYALDSIAGSGAFTYDGTAYDTLAAWIAAIEADATSLQPEFVSQDDGDFSLAEGSPLTDDGARWWTDERYTGADGDPFTDTDVSRGARQSKFVPFHPKQI